MLNTNDNNRHTLGNNFNGKKRKIVKWLSSFMSLIILGALNIVGSAEAAGLSSINSVYFYTHGWNTGLYTRIQASCSHGVYIDISADDGKTYYAGPQRGALNGLWQVNLPTMRADVLYKVIVSCHKNAYHGVAWRFNVRYKNGSLSGTYRTAVWTF